MDHAGLPFATLIERSVAARADLLDTEHRSALRLFNGFTEGFEDLVIDLYGCTLLIDNHAPPAESGLEHVRAVDELIRSRMRWIRTTIVKDRKATSLDEQRGRVLYGGPADDRIQENGIWYAIDLTLSRDASFYIDTRDLRGWALRHLGGKSVLNAFAYTGSLGVAAAAGGARQVVQLDRNHKSLDIARRSYALNGVAAAEGQFVQADFFREASRFRRSGKRFDCVFMDPPFFAAGPGGTVDQVHANARLINKARPLVEDGGCLVAINNALFVSGAEYMETLQSICADGYLRVAELIRVPDDCVGYGADKDRWPIADPAPFNHPTKIAILEVRRK